MAACGKASEQTVRDLLNLSYANLAMAHAAVSDQALRYQRTHYMIRARLLAGLRKGTMRMGSFLEDERLKLQLPQSCCYCGSNERLSIDHLVPLNQGGLDLPENMVWACRACNSSKGARDMLDWYVPRHGFPPLLLLRRYLKLALLAAEQGDFLDLPVRDCTRIPFSLRAIPVEYPQPEELRLWVTQLPR